MYDPIRLLVLGTGQMGSGIARLALKKPGLKLVGAYARRKDRADMDLGPLIGLDHDLGIAIINDVEEAIAVSSPDVAIQATCSTLADARAEITTLLENGIHVISIAEEMAFPACVSSEIADELHVLAVRNNVSVLGTGINPGFVLDTLVITLTGVCADVTAINATRVNDLSPYGPSVLSTQGVGLTVDEFHQGIQDHSVVGHIGFPQSIHMIARALGWDIERIEESREPIVSQVRRETEFITVEPDHVAGCLHTAVAYKDGKAVITLIHPQQVLPHLEGVDTGDSIEITGTPNIKLDGSPEIPGGQGTVAIAINSIPHVLGVAPGLHTMADLPVPSAALGDIRNRVGGGADD